MMNLKTVNEVNIANLDKDRISCFIDGFIFIYIYLYLFTFILFITL